MAKETKPIRIGSDIHRKLKIYAAKAEISVTDVVNQAVTNFMRDFSAEFLLNNSTTKSNKPVKK